MAFFFPFFFLQSLEEEPKFEYIDVYNEHTEYFSESQLIDKISNLEVLPV